MNIQPLLGVCIFISVLSVNMLFLRSLDLRFRIFPTSLFYNGGALGELVANAADIAV